MMLTIKFRFFLICLFILFNSIIGKEEKEIQNKILLFDIGFGQGLILDNRKLENSLNNTNFDTPSNHLYYASVTTSDSRRNYEYYELANDKSANFKTKSFRFGFEIQNGNFSIGVSFQNLNVIADNYFNQRLKPTLFPKKENSNVQALLDMYTYRNHNTNVISVFTTSIDLAYHFSPLDKSDFDPYIRVSFNSSKYSKTYSFGASSGIRYKVADTYAVFLEVYASEQNVNSSNLRTKQGIYSLFSDYEDIRYIAFREAGLRLGVSKLWL